MSWQESELVAFAVAEHGVEFKVHQYNYDDAPSNGNGPAYVLGPKNITFCDFPGCYVDSDFASETNSRGEYNEPQVAIGIEPKESGKIKASTLYSAFVNSVPGRGSSSLMKIAYYPTKRVAPLGVSGIFHCSDIPMKSVLRFQDNVRAPGCVLNMGLSIEKC